MKQSVKFVEYNFDVLSDGTIVFDEELELKDSGPRSQSRGGIQASLRGRA